MGDAVQRVVALQAQEPASPYVALWNRLRGFDPVGLDDAFASYAVVKAPLMRITLHAVAADDHPTFRAAMRTTLRAARLNDQRFGATGLSAADADALSDHVAAHARQPRSRAAIEALLAEQLGVPAERGVWWALRTVAPLVHAPTGGPWSFGRTPSFVAAPDGRGPPEQEEATRQLVPRYLAAFGPASRCDVAQFALLRMAELGPVLDALGDALVRFEGPQGEALYDVPGAPITDPDAPAASRLLVMWDSVLLAYEVGAV